jgi:hypothetical protein
MAVAKRVYRVVVGTLLKDGIVGEKLARASSQAAAVKAVLDQTVGVTVEVADTDDVIRLIQSGQKVLESGAADEDDNEPL